MDFPEITREVDERGAKDAPTANTKTKKKNARKKTSNELSGLFIKNTGSYASKRPSFRQAARKLRFV